MREEVLRMERVTYREQGVTLLDNFSMTIWAGEILGLVPANHLGLSALVRLQMCIRDRDKGRRDVRQGCSRSEGKNP